MGILILQATLAFWTIESLEIANTLTYGGVEAAQYPLDIYSRWFRDFLIFVVPIGCVGYFPIVRILGIAHRCRPGMGPRRGPAIRNHLSADCAARMARRRAPLHLDRNLALVCALVFGGR